ncbi:Phage tail sheath protein [Natronincola peptidivorans]|uniref:Phage tail sheath protein n=1 Tax=Natronincola peptidivorans TaxID=426128 RepID=A0A1I0FBN4_9FIRM|nr:phage tail sheath C-terminal domain-containing protein [Natronincola peptidivorans]SET55524.1 Phage tail sheath protein [Natronincola peptidivorans]
MGLPEIDIKFSTLAVSAIQRSQRGIVALILRDSTQTENLYEYRTVIDVDPADWTEENLQYIKDVFLGVPSRVIVLRGDTTDPNYNNELNILQNKRWNSLAIPNIASSDASDVASWLKSMRSIKKTFKAVLPNHTGDHEAIVNFTTEGIKVGENTYSASQYTARIAGILAGLGLDRSATYYELPEVEDITESADPNQDIDDGKLILIKQDDKVKIGRAVNSLTTTTVAKSKLFKKIKLVEGMDLIQEDISTTFNNEYVGKVNNSYDNQVLFITAVNAYLRGLRGTVLDPSHDNLVEVDIEVQRDAWEGIGTDTSEWSEQDVKEKSFESNVILSGNFKFLDAMEDLTMAIRLV